jgi:hypothetical protein
MAERGAQVTPNEIRKTALAILSSGAKLSRNAGSYLGICVATGAPLTDRQEEWLFQLAERANVEVPQDA